MYVQEYFRANTFVSASALPLEVSEYPPELDGGALSYRGALIEIQNLLDGLLMPCLPEPASKTIDVCEDLTRQYYTVRQLIDADGSATTEYTDATAWAIKAGVAPQHYSDYAEALFTDENALGGRFLTWQPNEKRVLPDQPEFLFWLNNVRPSPSVIKLRVQTMKADSTVNTFTAATMSGISSMAVYVMPVGPTALGLANDIYSYQVWVSNENDECLSEVRWYYVDRSYYRQHRYLIFSNSIGGFDTIACTGTSAEKRTSTRLISELLIRMAWPATLSGWSITLLESGN